MDILQTEKKLLLVSLLLASLIFIIDVNIPLGVAGGVPYILVILISLWSPRVRFTFFMAILCSLLTITGFFFSPEGGEIWKVLANRFLALFAIWVTALIAIYRKRAEKVIIEKRRCIQLMQEVAASAQEMSSIDDFMKICLDKICAHTNWPVGHVYLNDNGGGLLPTKIWHAEDREKFRNFIEITEGTVFKKGEGLPGRVLLSRIPHWIEDVTTDSNFPRAKQGKDLGVKGAFAFPVFDGKETVAVLEFFTETAQKPEKAIIDMTCYLATHLSHVIRRKRADDQIKESEKRFRILFEHAAVGVAQIISKTGHFVRMNNKYCEIIGYSRKEIEKLTFQKITHPDDLLTSQDNMKLLMRGEIQEFSMEKRYFHKNGSIVWVNLTVSSMWEFGEEPDCHIAVVQDVTERKKAGEEIEYQKNLFESIFNGVADAIVLTDVQRKIVMINPAFTRILGYSLQDIVGKETEVFYESREAYIKMGEERYNLKAEKKLKPYVVNYQRKDGTVFPGETIGTKIRSKNCEIVAFLGVIRDITERKKEEVEILKKEKLKATLELATTANHEINNLLTGIIGNTDIVLSAENLSEENKEELKIVLEQANKIAGVVKRLSNITKLAKKEYAEGIEMVDLEKSEYIGD